MPLQVFVVTRLLPDHDDPRLGGAFTETTAGLYGLSKHFQFAFSGVDGRAS